MYLLPRGQGPQQNSKRSEHPGEGGAPAEGAHGHRLRLRGGSRSGTKHWFWTSDSDSRSWILFYLHVTFQALCSQGKKESVRPI